MHALRCSTIHCKKGGVEPSETGLGVRDHAADVSYADFKQKFRVPRETFTCVVEACVSMRSQDRTMRAAVLLHMRVAVALYRLASSAEDGIVANVFGASRSFVNKTYRECVGGIARELEASLSGFLRVMTWRSTV